MAGGLGSTGYKQVTLNTKNPEQMGIFNSFDQGSRGGIQSGLANLSGLARGDQSQFEQLEAPAHRQFGQLQSQIASRFSGMGTGARRSSGHMNAQSGAATDFAERLQGQRMGLQQNAIQQLLGIGQNLLGQDMFDSHFMPKKKKWYEELLGSVVPGIAKGAGYGLTNGIF